jgi:hypothetical protein
MHYTMCHVLCHGSQITVRHYLGLDIPTIVSWDVTEKGIQMQPMSGYSPQENGAAERLNCTLWETTLTMLADSGLPKKWWAEAVVHAAHIHNVTNGTGGHTPWEHMKGEEPDQAP